MTAESRSIVADHLLRDLHFHQFTQTNASSFTTNLEAVGTAVRGGEQASKRRKIDFTKTILVTTGSGDQQTQITVHKDYITRRSPFVAAACSEEWSRDRSVDLGQVDSEVFQAYLQCLYEGTIMLLAGITGNRPGALLSLRYEHVKIALLRDPCGSEWPRLVVDVKFEHTKGYLGLKDPNTFPIPEVPNEPCLLLWPHVALLSLMFADEAFASPNVRSPEQLFRLQVPSGANQQELHIPFKDEMAGVPLKNGSRRGSIADRCSVGELAARDHREARGGYGPRIEDATVCEADQVARKALQQARRAHRSKWRAVKKAMLAEVKAQYRKNSPWRTLRASFPVPA